VVRKRLRSLEQYASDLLRLLRESFGKDAVRYNGNLHVFHVNDHLCINLAHLDGASSLIDQQGTNRSMILIEEVGDIPIEHVDTLGMALRKRATDRDGNELHRRMVINGNPLGQSHAVLFSRYIQGREGWVPFEFAGQTWVWVPGTLEDNPHLPEQYAGMFDVLAETDQRLFRAHRYGDWSVPAGGYFETSWSPTENVCRAEDIPREAFKRLEWGADWGTAAPAAFVLCGKLAFDVELPDGRVLGAGTIIVYDEHVEHVEGNLNQGTYRRPADIAPIIRQKSRIAGCGGHGDPRMLSNAPRGVMDSSAGAVQAGAGEPTVLDYFRLAGVKFRPARKGPRDNRTENLRELLARREVVVCDRCEYLLATLPVQPRDKADPSSMSSDGPDHAIDSLLYYIASQGAQIGGHSWK
jgi:hypothetical protein